MCEIPEGEAGMVRRRGLREGERKSEGNLIVGSLIGAKGVELRGGRERERGSLPVSALWSPLWPLVLALWHTELNVNIFFFVCFSS